MRRISGWCLLMLVLCLGARASAGREWKSSNGKFTIDAEFVAVRSGKVVLEKPDGSYLSVPLEKLSDEDLEFIEEESGQPVSRKEADGEEPPSNQKTAGNRSGGPPLVKFKGEKPTDPPGEARAFSVIGSDVKSLAFSPDGGLLAVAQMDGVLLVFDLVQGNCKMRLENRGLLGRLDVVAFTPDGKKLLAGGDTQLNGYEGRIVAWDVSPSGELKKYGQFSGQYACVNCIAVSADSKFALSVERSRIRYWQIDTGKEIGVFDGLEGKVRACRLSKDGRTAYATDGGTLLTIDLKREKVDRRKLTSSWEAGNFAAISCDCRLVAAGDNHNVRVWEIISGKELPVLKGDEPLWSGTFTPDCARLLTGGGGKVNVWDVKRSRRISEVQTAGTHYVDTLAASPDNWHMAAIAGAWGKKLQVFRIPKN